MAEKALLQRFRALRCNYQDIPLLEQAFSEAVAALEGTSVAGAEAQPKAFVLEEPLAVDAFVMEGLVPFSLHPKA